MTRKAVVVGIEDYKPPLRPLRRCVEDADQIAKLLARHEDGSRNFDVLKLAGGEGEVCAKAMREHLALLFNGPAQIALLYFSGHGALDPQTGKGHLVSQDGREGAWGLPLDDVLNLANRAHPRIGSVVIILDSCHAGAAGLDAAGSSVLGPGVTLMAASRSDQAAYEGGSNGVFTGLLIDGLSGGAADVCGDVSPASLYAHVEQALGPWEQRPVYKANVQNFVSLRQVPPRAPLETLRRLPRYFPRADSVYPLDPSCEEDRRNLLELNHIPVDPERVKIFKELQRCSRHGLVAPVGVEFMYHAAISSTGCRLTPLGAHYRRLAEAGRL